MSVPWPSLSLLVQSGTFCPAQVRQLQAVAETPFTSHGPLWETRGKRGSRATVPPLPSLGLRASGRGIDSHMEAVTAITDVRTFETSGGNVRYVVRDADGNEYSTFREGIGKRAQELEGRPVRIEYHEQQRGQYTNIYLDKVEAAPTESVDSGPRTGIPRRSLGARQSMRPLVDGLRNRARPKNSMRQLPSRRRSPRTSRRATRRPE